MTEDQRFESETIEPALHWIKEKSFFRNRWMIITRSNIITFNGEIIMQYLIIIHDFEKCSTTVLHDFELRNVNSQALNFSQRRAVELTCCSRHYCEDKYEDDNFLEHRVHRSSNAQQE